MRTEGWKAFSRTARRPAAGPSRGGGTAVLLAAALLTYATCATASDSPPPDTRRGTIVLPSGGSLSVEVADTPQRQALGYMFRKEVPEGEGMIFLMSSLDIHPFWMKNCLTALDIIWMDETWRIVHIEPSLPPCKKDPCPSYAPMVKSRYVLEVGPGQAAKLGLRLGDRLIYLPPPPPGKPEKP